MGKEKSSAYQSIAEDICRFSTDPLNYTAKDYAQLNTAYGKNCIVRNGHDGAGFTVMSLSTDKSIEEAYRSITNSIAKYNAETGLTIVDVRKVGIAVNNLVEGRVSVVVVYK